MTGRPRPVEVRPWPGHHPFAASITFDGGYAEAVDRAFPVLEAAGVPSTWFLVAGAVGGHLEGRAVAGWERWRQLAATGLVEVGNHTLTHPLVRRSAPDLARWLLSPSNMASRARRIVRRQPRTGHERATPAGAAEPVGRSLGWRAVARDSLAAQEVLVWQVGGPVESFAYPNGRAHPRLARRLSGGGLVALRTTDAGDGGIGELTAVPGHLFTLDTTGAEARSWIASAESHRGWYVDVHHLVTDDPGYLWSTRPDLFEAQLADLRAAGAWFATVGDAARQVRGSAEVEVLADDDGDVLRLSKSGPVAVTVRVPLEGRRVQLADDGPCRLDGDVLSWAAGAGTDAAEVAWAPV